MRFDVLTLHPAMVAAPLGSSILGRARDAGAFGLGVRDLRDAATGRHRAVDDTPYGGGAGMVLRVDVVARAIASVRRPDSHVILTGPGGTRFDQAVARRFASLPHLVIVCGHYEGTDARVEDQVDEEVSLGDFVLTGGEIAACAIVDAVARLLPGVLHNDSSAVDESFGDGLLEYPQFTRPRAFGGFEVPEVLVGGHHGRIAAWRREASLARTRLRRPDLFARHAPAPPRSGRRRRVDGPDDGD